MTTNFLHQYLIDFNSSRISLGIGMASRIGLLPGYLQAVMTTFFLPIKFCFSLGRLFFSAYITQISSFQALPAGALAEEGCMTAIVSGAMPFSLRYGLRMTRFTRSGDNP